MIEILYGPFLMRNEAKLKIIAELLDEILTKLCAKRGVEKQCIES